MAYREPAEDEEAKLDAAEVDAFRQKLARDAARAQLRGYAVLLGSLAVAALAIAAMFAFMDVPSPRPHQDCHHAARFHDENGVLTREDILVCPDAGP
jgi:hypothetical protein